MARPRFRLEGAYRAKHLPSADASFGTEERLRRVTSFCVLLMIERGYDAEAIRSSVLTLAQRVIQELADDGYKAETHVAIVQRTVDGLLERLKDGPSGRPADVRPPM
jgi:hypothetical protein